MDATGRIVREAKVASQRACKFARGRPASQYSAHIGLGLAAAAVRPPNRGASNLFVLRIGIEDGADINGRDRPQQEAVGMGSPPSLTGIPRFLAANCD